MATLSHSPSAELKRPKSGPRRQRPTPLARSVLELYEADSAALGKTLHHQLGQQLTGTVLLCNLLEASLKKRRSPDLPAAARIAKLLDEARRELRGVMRDLVPINDSPEALMTALEHLAHQISEERGIECRFAAPLPVLVEDPLIAITLFRIAETTVSAVLDKFEPKALEIALSRQRQRVIVSFNFFATNLPRDPSKWFGPVELRVTALHGTFSIHKKPRREMIIRCSIPLTASPRLSLR